MPVPKFVFGSEIWVGRDENVIKINISKRVRINTYLLHEQLYYYEEMPLIYSTEWITVHSHNFLFSSQNGYKIGTGLNLIRREEEEEEKELSFRNER
jgi:hypothetical protein